MGVRRQPPLPSPGRGKKSGHRRTPASPPSDGRALAWEILQRVETGGYADALLGHGLRVGTVPARDHALVTRLVYGTLAWQGYLDHFIAAFSRRPPQDLDPPVRALLRLALFQTCVLTKIPDFAAVNTAVHLAKRYRGGSAVSFVNAVLRRAAAGWRDVRFPSAHEDPVGDLALRLSHPRWLVERWVADYGMDETAALLQANNEAAPTMLRVNRHKAEPSQLLARLRDSGFAASPTSYSPVGLRLDATGALEALPGHAEGLFTVQGEASQLVGFLVAPQPGERVLDACAAPGGKTTHLAELMNDQGSIVALDPHPRGVARVRHMAERLGLSTIKACTADATTWTPDDAAAHGGQFDRVLVDAPCSGLGTLRQHPEVKWRRTPADIAGLAALQQRLLQHLAADVRPGGTLVYATCTLSAPENEEVLAAFLQRQPAFRIEDARGVLPVSAHTLVGEDGVLRTLPHRDGLDGFFAVRLKRLAAHDIVSG